MCLDCTEEQPAPVLAPPLEGVDTNWDDDDGDDDNDDDDGPSAFWCRTDVCGAMFGLRKAETKRMRFRVSCLSLLKIT